MTVMMKQTRKKLTNEKKNNSPKNPSIWRSTANMQIEIRFYAYNPYSGAEKQGRSKIFNLRFVKCIWKSSKQFF